MPRDTEIGRELKAGELVPKMIVWTNPEHRPDVFATLWVTHISDGMVWLYAGKNPTVKQLGLFVQPDGSLKDDGGRTIRILEYLGKA